MKPTVSRGSYTYCTEREGAYKVHRVNLCPMHKDSHVPEEWGVANTPQLVNKEKHMICNNCNTFSSYVSISVLGKPFPALTYNYLSEKWLLRLEGGKQHD
jgi:hypothetical protein